jgi:hypothetical protein
VGNEQLWRAEVSVYRDNKSQDSVAVLSKNGRPRILLVPGKYEVAGRLRWRDQPQSIPIPSDSAIVQLEIDGRRVARPDFNDAGMLWLQRARNESNPASLRMNRSTENWPEQETWSLKSANALSGGKNSGVKTLDPSQIDLPRPWYDLPTYLVTGDSTFEIEEQYRGDTSNSSNQISLQRGIFLDFDGAGTTISDRLTGSIGRTPRLFTQPALDLGRASLRGEPALITQLENESGKSVEIRDTNLNLKTVNRLEDLQQLTATDWQQNIASLSVALALPARWRLWHALGPDNAQASRLSRWTLWDIFLFLLISGTIFKLMGVRWAILSIATFALYYHENNVALISWLVLILALPLLRVLPAGRIRLGTNVVAYLTLFALTLSTLVFAVKQIRIGLYPQLEHQNATAVVG